MRRSAFLLFCGFIFSHCQKDASMEPPPAVLSDQLLDKELYTWPTGQFADSYAYNADGKLVSLVKADLNTGKFSRQDFLRDKTNRIIRVSRSENGSSSLRDVAYVSNSDNKILHIRGFNGAVNDSTTFSYNAAGRIISSDLFANIKNDGTGSLTPNLNHLSNRKYDYDANGNLVQITFYSDQDNNGSFTFNFSYTFTYDTQKNPLYFPGDAAVLIDDLWYKIASPNNVTRHINNFGPQAPAPDDTLNYAYAYTPDGLPLICNYTTGSTKVKVDYYY